MLNPDVLVLISIICILPAVITGAVIDWRRRKFPSFLWTTPAKISGIFTFLLYMYSIANQQYLFVAGLVFISLVFFFAFYIITLRYGSGGDYRALMYASVLLPTLIIQIAIVATLVGILQVVINGVTKKDAPWAIGICISILVALGTTAYGISGTGIFL